MPSFTTYNSTGMESRSVSSEAYRFGFNGMEKDPEITGQEGSHYTAPFWEYDTRIARRWNVKTVVKFHENSYAAFANNPIWFVVPIGADTILNGLDNNGTYLPIDVEFEDMEFYGDDSEDVVGKFKYEQVNIGWGFGGYTGYDKDNNVIWRGRSTGDGIGLGGSWGKGYTYLPRT
jgi:hypothetical protein